MVLGTLFKEARLQSFYDILAMLKNYLSGIFLLKKFK